MCPWRRRRVRNPARTSLSLRFVALRSCLRLPSNTPDVDGELVSDNRAAAVACREFDTFDLRRQLATFSHRDLLSLSVQRRVTMPPRGGQR